MMLQILKTLWIEGIYSQKIPNITGNLLNITQVLIKFVFKSKNRLIDDN